MSAITFEGLTKRYGAITAVDGLTAEVRPGRVTAFLGANGSGKTTTMRVLLGLSEPTSGVALVGDRAYRELPNPMRTIGAVLDQGFHPNRSARSHLHIVAAQAGVTPPGSMTCWPWPGSRTPRDAGSAASPWACGNACPSRRR
jgi:ABC-2 type transport system ATP-binding protein